MRRAEQFAAYPNPRCNIPPESTNRLTTLPPGATRIAASTSWRAATPKQDAAHLRIVASLPGESDCQGQTPESLNLNQRLDLALAVESGHQRLSGQIVAQQRATPRRRQRAIQQPLLSADRHAIAHGQIVRLICPGFGHGKLPPGRRLGHAVAVEVRTAGRTGLALRRIAAFRIQRRGLLHFAAAQSASHSGRANGRTTARGLPPASVPSRGLRKPPRNTTPVHNGSVPQYRIADGREPNTASARSGKRSSRAGGKCRCTRRPWQETL